MCWEFKLQHCFLWVSAVSAWFRQPACCWEGPFLSWEVKQRHWSFTVIKRCCKISFSKQQCLNKPTAWQLFTFGKMGFPKGTLNFQHASGSTNPQRQRVIHLLFCLWTHYLLTFRQAHEKGSCLSKPFSQTPPSPISGHQSPFPPLFQDGPELGNITVVD